MRAGELRDLIIPLARELPAGVEKYIKVALLWLFSQSVDEAVAQSACWWTVYEIGHGTLVVPARAEVDDVGRRLLWIVWVRAILNPPIGTVLSG